MDEFSEDIREVRMRPNSTAGALSIFPNWFNGIVRRMTLRRERSNPELGKENNFKTKLRALKPPTTPSPTLTPPNSTILKRQSAPFLTSSPSPSATASTAIVVLEDSESSTPTESREHSPVPSAAIKTLATTATTTPTPKTLTKAEISQQIKTYQSYSKDDVIISKFKMNITRSSLDLLLNDNWINDEILNFYMNLIVERSEHSGGALPRVHAMSTFFLLRLLMSGYEGVRRWTRGIDIFEKDIIFVPVNDDNEHWSLAVVHFRDKYITYLDSAGSKNKKLLLLLKHYVEEESQAKRQIDFDASDFRIEHPRNFPQQENLHDCGIFCCAYADYLARDVNFDFDQDDMPCFREKIFLEIATGNMINLVKKKH